MTMFWQATRTYPCDHASPADARRFTTEQLGDVLGVDADAQAVIDSAELVISELITNAINAGCSDTGLVLNLYRDVLRIAVNDDCDGVPTPWCATERDDHGRGLQIVDALSRAWGVRQLAVGKQVWAELVIPRPAPGAPTD